MDRVLQGFTEELVKLSSRRSDEAREEEDLRALYRQVKARSTKGLERSGLEKLRGKGRPVSRDYLASTIIGAAATPLAMLMGGKLSRALHNREVRFAMKGLRGKRRAAVAKMMESGPMIGPMPLPGSGRKRPMMTRAELAGHAVRGGAMGSIIQMLRDKFSGSAGAGDNR
jgi:hypothetical protein